MDKFIRRNNLGKYFFSISSIISFSEGEQVRKGFIVNTTYLVFQSMKVIAPTFKKIFKYVSEIWSLKISQVTYLFFVFLDS